MKCKLPGCDTLLKKTQRAYCSVGHYKKHAKQNDTWSIKFSTKKKYNVDARLDQDLEDDLKKVR